MDIKRIRINKNRGWRGLAELVCENDKREEVSKMIFSFSEPVWRDMLKGYIVTQDEDNYIILNFDNIEKLPAPTQQRSVLIKSFIATVIEQTVYPKKEWTAKAQGEHFRFITNFIKNRNNHTTSDWNCIRNTCHPIYIVNRLERRELFMKYVYVITENGSWDYEPTNPPALAYKDFETALEKFRELVSIAERDIRDWLDNWDEDSEVVQIEMNVNKTTQDANCNVYENGDYTRFHDTIKLEKVEVK